VIHALHPQAKADLEARIADLKESVKRIESKAN
jgi:hypothetical protein